MNNALKSWSFLVGLSVTLIVFGHWWLGREGLLIGLIAALGINSYVYFFEDRRIIESLGGRRLEGKDPWGVLGLARTLAAKARIPAPQVVILSDAAPQALVVGRSLTSGTIILTEGLLEQLDRDEVEAVLAYLVACVKNLNTLAFSVGSFLASSLLSVTGLLDTGLRLLIVEKKNTDSFISHLFTRAMAPVVGFLVRISIRQQFYIDADRTASELLGDSKSLATAIWKLHSYSMTRPFQAPLAISHMFVVNPLTKKRWNRYFHAQPRPERRIRALTGHFPI